MTELRLSPAEAWVRLEAGNRHWALGRLEHPDQDTGRRQAVAARQDPFATIVSCIDSRLPPETVFDQGIGDLFAVRTGAQTIDGLVTASIEYGPLENGTPLVVVMGHKRCGAVTAAVHAIQSGAHLPGHLDAIVQRLRPAFHAATGTTPATEAAAFAAGVDEAALIDQVIRAQILRVARSLTHDGPLATLVERGELGIVGAYYDLDTGLVARLHALGLSTLLSKRTRAGRPLPASAPPWQAGVSGLEGMHAPRRARAFQDHGSPAGCIAPVLTQDHGGRGEEV